MSSTRFPRRISARKRAPLEIALLDGVTARVIYLLDFRMDLLNRV
jgi:hypothetical protein